MGKEGEMKGVKYGTGEKSRMGHGGEMKGEGIGKGEIEMGEGKECYGESRNKWRRLENEEEQG